VHIFVGWIFLHIALPRVERADSILWMFVEARKSIARWILFSSDRTGDLRPSELLGELPRLNLRFWKSISPGIFAF